MVDELKELVGMIANLPNFALWVIAALLAYKVMVIGSIYGVVRLGINKLHGYLTTPKHKLEKVHIEATLRELTLSSSHELLIAQIHRLVGATLPNAGLRNIHAGDVEFLRDALDAAFEKKNREANSK